MDENYNKGQYSVVTIAMQLTRERIYKKIRIEEDRFLLDRAELLGRVSKTNILSQC